MRPLFVDFANDTRSWEIDSAYMFGDALLVAPVLAPGVKTMTVWLPPLPGNGAWTSLWDRRTSHVGGRAATVQVTKARIPVFVREDVAVAKLLPRFPRDWR